MDERRRQLVAAAEALRGWVHSQNATSHQLPVMTFTPLRTLAVAAAPMPPIAEVMTGPERPASPDAAPQRISIGLLAPLKAALRGTGRVFEVSVAVLGRVWRPVVAGVAVIAFAGLARTSWPQWSRAIKAQLAAAGEHASVFERPAPEPPVAGPSKAKGVGAGKRNGHLHVDSTPAGAHVLVDGRDRGVTPLTVNELAVGTHLVILKTDTGTVQRSVIVAGDKTTQLNEAIYSGWLHVSSSVDLQVSEGGHSLRLDDSNQVLLPPGTHDLRFENRTFGFVETRTVDIRPGDTTSLVVEPPASKLSISASTPAEVLVDGTLIGGTPLNDYAIPVGTREITVRNATGAERRTVVTMTVEPVKLEIDFSK